MEHWLFGLASSSLLWTAVEAQELKLSLSRGWASYSWWYFFALAVTVFLCLDAAWSWWRNRVLRPRPGPWYSPPIIGDIIPFVQCSFRWLENRLEKTNYRTRASLFGFEMFITGRPEDLKYIFNAEGKEVLSWAPEYIHKLEGKALPMLLGVKHGVVRKAMLTNLFSPKAMRSYFDDMYGLVDKHIKQWVEMGPHLTMSPVLRVLAFAVVYGCMIDMNTVEDQTRLDLYEKVIQGFSCLPIDLPFTTLGKAVRAKRKLKDDILKLVANAREEMKAQQNEVKRSSTSVINTLLRIQMELEEKGGEEGVLLDDDDVVDNLLTFLIAGHETVLASMTSMMKFVGERPDVMKKAREEVLKISPPGQPLTWDQVQAMSYCHGVVKETLRFLPPVSIGLKQVLKDFELNGCKLKKGERIMMYYMTVHKLSFTNPSEFDPERFDTASPKYHNEYAKDDRKMFCTFSGGPRSCVGMSFAMLEMQLLLITLLKNDITWKLAPDQDLNLYQEGISIKIGDGVKVLLSKLSN